MRDDISILTPGMDPSENFTSQWYIMQHGSKIRFHSLSGDRASEGRRSRPEVRADRAKGVKYYSRVAYEILYTLGGKCAF